MKCLADRLAAQRNVLVGWNSTRGKITARFMGEKYISFIECYKFYPPGTEVGGQGVLERRESRSSLVAQWLSGLGRCCGIGSIPGPGTKFHKPQGAAKKKKKKEKKRKKKQLGWKPCILF